VCIKTISHQNIDWHYLYNHIQNYVSMKIQKLFPFIIAMTITCISFAQSPLEVEQYDKRLSMDVAQPGVSIHFPTGLIYEDINENGFTNLSEYLLRIADKPFGYQVQTENVIYSQMTKNTFSINHYDTPWDNILLLGPEKRASWEPRNPASPWYYDLKTFGNMFTVDIADRKLTELREESERGAIRFYRYANGFIYYHTLTLNAAGNPVWLAASDRHAKENIKNSQNILPRLIQLELKDYNYKGVETPTTGYIAQEVQDVFPDLVEEMEDGRLGVNYMGFSPLAVQAIKEQQKIIEGLESRLKKVEELLNK